MAIGKMSNWRALVVETLRAILQYDTMDSKSYLTLNSWLQKSDNNYIAGRFLWKHLLISQACNLLWLASEQMIKTLLLQNNIAKFSEQASGINDLYLDLDQKAQKLGHNTSKLFSRMALEYPELCIAQFKPSLEKINEQFYRRYVVNSGSSIGLNVLNEIDTFYFILRGMILPDVGLGLIDDIYIQKKHGWKHPISSFCYAYFENDHFRSRKHREIQLIGPDGKVFSEDGS